MKQAEFDKANKIIAKITNWNRYRKDLRHKIWEATGNGLHINDEVEPCRQYLYDTVEQFCDEQVVNLKKELAEI